MRHTSSPWASIFKSCAATARSRRMRQEDSPQDVATVHKATSNIPHIISSSHQIDFGRLANHIEHAACCQCSATRKIIDIHMQAPADVDYRKSNQCILRPNKMYRCNQERETQMLEGRQDIIVGRNTWYPYGYRIDLTKRWCREHHRDSFPLQGTPSFAVSFLILS